MSRADDICKQLELSREVARLGPGTKVLQIGAGDGRLNDPIHVWAHRRPHWRFFRVEARPDLFLELDKHCAKLKNVTLHQAAILEEAGEGCSRPFFVFDEEVSPAWARMAGSLSKEKLETLKSQENIQADIEVMDMWCQSLSQVQKEMWAFNMDAVYISMGGEEAPVVDRFIDIGNVRVIAFHHVLMPRQDYVQLTAKLASRGYRKQYSDKQQAVWCVEPNF